MTSYVCNEGKLLARFLRVREKGRFTTRTVVMVITFITSVHGPDFSKGFLGKRKNFQSIKSEGVAAYHFH